MPPKSSADLRTILKDAHAHFFLLKGEEISRLKLWEILSDALVIELPQAAPMRRSMVGLVPTIDGSGIYEIDGTVEIDPLPDQMPGTFRLQVDPENVRKVNRRLYPRISFTPPVAVAVTPEGGKRAIDGRIINLSAGGLRVESDEPLPASRPLAFRFEVECDDELHAIARTGTVVYELPLEKGFAYGIRFGRDDEDTLSGEAEASVETIERTVDLMALVNRLLVRK